MARALSYFVKKALRAKAFSGGGSLVSRFRKAVHHVLNPLHVYCRLKDMGLSGPMAHKMCRAYERFVFRLIP